MQQHAGLNDLFVDTLKDIYSAEKQILRSLPKMARAAGSAALREAFLTHREQTEDQIGRLDQVFELIGEKPGRKTCEAMQGILEEGDETIADYAGSDALDAGLVAAGQAVEHYEISRYTALRDWATALGLDEAATLLTETLDEETETDRLLSEIAGGSVNEAAMGEAAPTASVTKARAGVASQQKGAGGKVATEAPDPAGKTEFKDTGGKSATVAAATKPTTGGSGSESKAMPARPGSTDAGKPSTAAPAAAPAGGAVSGTQKSAATSAVRPGNGDTTSAGRTPGSGRT